MSRNRDSTTSLGIAQGRTLTDIAIEVTFCS